MRNTHLFYIVFQILKVLPIKTYKILLPVPLLVVVLYQQISFLQLFRTLFNIAKKIFATNLPCFIELFKRFVTLQMSFQTLWRQNK